MMTAGQELVTQESLLLGTAERVGRIREGRMAVHLHLSRLRAHNRQESYLRIIVRMLDPLVTLNRGQLFLLSNADIVILVKDVSPADLDTYVYRVRSLFANDPLTYGTDDGGDRFFSWYDLDTDYDDFLELARRLDAEVGTRPRARDDAKPPPPLDPDGLAKILGRLEGFDLAPLVRRQSAIGFDGKSARAVFQEFFFSMGDLRQALAPETDITADPWLFRHLSRELDQRMLSAVRDMRLREPPPAASLNLNLATVLSPQFDGFEQAVAGRMGLLVEVEVVDIFADLGNFFYARDRLRERGHKLILDGLGTLALDFVDLGLCRTDFFKLVWSPDFAEGDNANRVQAAFAGLGIERVILGRCDSEAAIQWGMGLGIPTFQGRYVDAMTAAVAMARCSHAGNCTLAQCIARHGVTAGPRRAECGNHDMLDSFPAIRVPDRRPGGGGP